MVSAYNEPAVGDRVLIPWGLEEVLGEVVEVYRTGLGPRAKIRVVDDPDGPTVTVPLDSVTAEGEPGGRVEAATAAAAAANYEAHLDAALERVLMDLKRRRPDLNARRIYDLNIHPAADFEVRFGKRRLLIEARYSATQKRVTTDTVLTYAGLAESFTGVLLVANTPLASTAEHRLEQLWGHRTFISFARWRSPADDRQLREGFDRFFKVWNLGP